MRLIKNNNPFTCVVCGKEVGKAKGNSRDHCCFCLCSLHVDLTVPGDRKNTCCGIMRPVSIKNWKGDSYKIEYTCELCGARHWNITASDDSMDAIGEVMAKHNQALIEPK